MWPDHTMWPDLDRGDNSCSLFFNTGRPLRQSRLHRSTALPMANILRLIPTLTMAMIAIGDSTFSSCNPSSSRLFFSQSTARHRQSSPPSPSPSPRRLQRFLSAGMPLTNISAICPCWHQVPFMFAYSPSSFSASTESSSASQQLTRTELIQPGSVWFTLVDLVTIFSPFFDRFW